MDHIPVFILVLLVDAAHQSSSGRQNLVDEDENGLLRRQLDTLTNHVDELAHREICGDQVLLLVNSRDVALLDLLANNLLSILSATVVARQDGKGRAVSFW